MSVGIRIVYVGGLLQVCWRVTSRRKHIAISLIYRTFTGNGLRAAVLSDSDKLSTAFYAHAVFVSWSTSNSSSSAAL